MFFNETFEAAIDPAFVEEVAKDWRNIESTILVGFAGFTVLVYDHVITFADEVQYIWLELHGLPAYLFLINRYVIPLGFIVNLYAYLANWDPNVCASYVRYEGAMTVTGINIVGLMMLLRIRALYNKNRFVVWPVALLLAIEFGVNAWLLDHGIPAPHRGPRFPCTMVFEASLTKIASASAWLPLLYDTIVMFLTFYKVFQSRTPSGRIYSQILQTVLAEGIAYYSMIFSVNLALTIMIPTAPSSIQNITAQLSLLLTVAMMSRITLDLKKHAWKDSQHETSEIPHCYQMSRIRFRDVITGRKSMGTKGVISRDHLWKGGPSSSAGVASALVFAQGVAPVETRVEEGFEVTRDPHQLETYPSDKKSSPGTGPTLPF